MEKNFRGLKHFQEEKVGSKWDTSEEREQKKCISNEMDIVFGSIPFTCFYIYF